MASFATKDIVDAIEDYEDAFGERIAPGIQNKLDLPSTYDFNTERFLLYVNGDRVNPDTTTFQDNFTDQPAAWDLTPSAGDRVELRARERPRYVPGFEVLWGIAWHMSSTLPDGGTITVGLRDAGENAFKVEYTNEDVTARIIKNGSETTSMDVTDGYMRRQGEMTLQDKLRQPQIDRHRANMYGVGLYKPGVSYLAPASQAQNELGLDSDAGLKQRNVNLAAETLRENGVGAGDGVGLGNQRAVNTDEFNMHLSIEIDLSGASSGARLSALSQQYIVLGDVTPTVRPKPFTFFDLSDSVSGGWNDGVVALRTDPSRENVATELSQLSCTPSGGTVELVAFAFDPDSLSFSESNFAPVEEHAMRGGENSVVEANLVDAPFSYPTETYTNPAGNQVSVPAGRGLSRVTEQVDGRGNELPEGEQVDTERQVFNDDIVLLVPRGAPGVSGVSLSTLGVATRQDW